jgi:hypothetical protein
LGETLELQLKKSVHHIIKRFPEVEGHLPTRVLRKTNCDSAQNATLELGTRTPDDHVSKASSEKHGHISHSKVSRVGQKVELMKFNPFR